MSDRSLPRFGTAAYVALVCAVLLPAIGSWQIMRTRAAVLVDAEQNTRTLAHALAQHASGTVQAVDLVLSDICEQLRRPDRTALKGYILRQANALSQSRSIVIGDAQGDTTIDAAMPMSKINVADREYFRWHRDHDDPGLHFGDKIVSRVSGLPVIPLSRRINDPASGAFAGVVVASLLPDYLEDFFRSLSSNRRDAFTLTSATGTLLVRYPAPPHEVDPGAFDFGRLSATQAIVLRAHSPYDGIDRIVAFERLERYPLVVSAAVSVDDALASWRLEAATEGSVLLAGSVILVLLTVGLERHRRSATRQLEAKSAQLAIALDHMNHGLMKVGADGLVEFSNRRLHDLLGLDPATSSRPLRSFEDVTELMQTHEGPSTTPAYGPPNRGSILRRRGLDRYELSHAGGAVIEVRTVPMADGGFVQTYADISEQRQAEDALRESEVRYRTLADTTSDVITQLDLAFRRRYVSPACRVVFGFEPEEMIGTRPSATIHPDEAASVRRMADGIVAGKVPGDRVTLTYRMLHKEGHWVWVEAGINLVRDPHTGAAKSLICSLRDVTERQRIARHLEQAKLAAEHAARQKADFVANMSHELRTPLTGILGLHDLLGADPTLGPKQRRYLIMARDAGQSLLTVVNDVLDFSKIEAGELTIEKVPFDLLSLVEACEDLNVEAARAKSLWLDMRVPDKDLILIGDPSRLKQILLNLVGNAVKFTERGGVMLSARFDPCTARLRFEVTDTGVGIPAHKLNLLFKRFSQADTSTTRRFGGSGLGLAICKRLAELMGGEIGVLSDPEHGSTFWLEVPALEATGKRHVPQDTLLGVIPRRRILLAEDNPLNQEMIKAVLEARGHVVTLVDNGAAAAAAARSDTPFDLILMDLQMPIMDGLSATRVIRSAEQADRRAATPIIGLTANAMVEDVERCHNVGMEAHVAKPIDWAELFGVMERLTSVAA